MNKCTNPEGHKFTPVEWREEVIPPLTPGNTSESLNIKRKTVEEVMCIYCEWFKRLNRR